MKKYVIGLYGMSGSGKSAAAAYLASRGAEVIDCDAVYHEMVSAPSPCLAAIEKEFGSTVIAGGALDRRALSKIVFSHPARLARLNTITHIHVIDEVKKRIAASEKRVCVIDAPLLYEAGAEALCDVVIAVTAPRDVRRTRIIARDGLTAEEADRRLDARDGAEETVARADIILENGGNFAAFEQALADAVDTLGCFRA